MARGATALARATSVEATDDELVAAYRRSHDRAAFELLLERQRPMLQAMRRGFFIRGSDREDVWQEMLIGFAKAVRDFDETKGISFKSFARGCVERHLITAVRAANRFKHAPLTDADRLDAPMGADGEGVTMGEVLPLHTADPADSVADQEDMRGLTKALGLRVTPAELERLLANLDPSRVAEVAALLVEPLPAGRKRRGGTKLSEAEAEVLLHRLLDTPYAEMAQLMGKDVKYVDNCVQRFRRKFACARDSTGGDVEAAALLLDGGDAG